VARRGTEKSLGFLEVLWVDWLKNWLVLWNMNGIWLSIYWECHHPNWLNWLIFFRGVGIPPTRYLYIYIYVNQPFQRCRLKPPTSKHGFSTDRVTLQLLCRDLSRRSTLLKKWFHVGWQICCRSFFNPFFDDQLGLSWFVKHVVLK
jgi:hypothetical protein